MSEIKRLTDKYRTLFGEWPPTWGYLRQDAIREIRKAIETGQRMSGAQTFYNLPEDVLI